MQFHKVNLRHFFGEFQIDTQWNRPYTGGPMPGRKGPPQKKSTSKESGSSQIEHYNAILLEDMRSEFKFVTEGLVGLREEIERNRKEDKFETESNFRDMRSLLRALYDKNERDFSENQANFSDMKSSLANLSNQVEKVVDKVEQHDKDIKDLKSASIAH